MNQCQWVDFGETIYRIYRKLAGFNMFLFLVGWHITGKPCKLFKHVQTNSNIQIWDHGNRASLFLCQTAESAPKKWKHISLCKVLQRHNYFRNMPYPTQLQTCRNSKQPRICPQDGDSVLHSALVRYQHPWYLHVFAICSVHWSLTFATCVLPQGVVDFVPSGCHTSSGLSSDSCWLCWAQGFHLCPDSMDKCSGSKWIPILLDDPCAESMIRFWTFNN